MLSTDSAVLGSVSTSPVSWGQAVVKSHGHGYRVPVLDGKQLGVEHQHLALQSGWGLSLPGTRDRVGVSLWHLNSPSCSMSSRR